MSVSSGIKAHWGFRSLLVRGDAAHDLAVNTGNGNLLVTATDYVFPARIPAVLMRSYNSSDAGSLPANSMLGRGWRFCFEEKLEILGGTGDVRYTDTTGAEFIWTASGSGFARPVGVFSDLTLDLVSAEFTLAMPNGFLRVFDAGTGLLKRYADHNGNELRFSRGAGGELTSIECNSPNGFIPLLDTFTYANGRLVTIGLSTVGGGLYWALTYDATNELLEGVTDPLGQTWGYSYDDPSNRLVAVTDPNGSVANPPYSTAIAYDGTGHVARLTDQSPSNELIAFAYGGLVTTITDRRGNSAVMTHGAADLELLSVELPLPAPHNTTHFAWSNLTMTSVTDPLGHATTYSYDSNGNLLTVSDAAGNVTALTYNANNTLATVATPLGNETALFYDSITGRNLTELRRPLQQTTAFEYNQQGDLTASIDPLGQRTEFEYEPTYGYRTKRSVILDPQSSFSRPLTTQFEYSPEGIYLLGSTNPCGIVTKLSADAIGRTLNIAVLMPEGASSIVTQFEYDRCGNVLVTTDPRGNQTIRSYSRLGHLAAETLPESTGAPSAAFAYDAEEDLTSVTRAIGGTQLAQTQYTYDAANRLVSITLPPATSDPDLPGIYTLAYDGAGNLISRADALGNTVTYTYTVLNQVRTESGPLAGLKFEYAYDADGRLTEIVGQPGNLPAGYTARSYLYAYDGNGRLVAVDSPLIDGERFRTEYSYRDNDQLASIRLPAQVEGNGPPSRAYGYDSVGRLSTVTDALGCTLRYFYRDDGRLSQKVDAEGRATSFAYDAAGRLTQTSQPLGAFSSYILDLNGNVLELDGPDGFKTTYSYDGRSRLTAMVRIDSSVNPERRYATTYTYDELDRITSIVDPRNKLDTFAFDARGRLVQANVDVNHPGVTDGFNYESSFTYDPCDRLVRQANPDGGTIEYAYDAGGRVIAVTDEAGAETSLTYDLWGMLVKRVWPDLVEETYAFDPLDRLILQENHLGEEVAFDYDRNGNNTSILSPFGLRGSFAYNLRDELVYSATASEGSQPRVENFAYTPNGRLAAYTGPNQESWTFQYDALGRWTSASTNLGRSATRSYNPSNTLAATQGFDGLRFSMAYNGMRLRTATIADSAAAPNETSYDWEYIDLKEVTEPSGRVQTFTRDRLGRITSTTLTAGGTDSTTEYGYNWRGQVTHRNLPSGLGEEDYTYDLRGLLTGIEYSSPPASVEISYDIRGRQQSVVFSDGVRRDFVYNRLGRLVLDSVTDSAGNIFQTFYSYDRAGDRVAEILSRKLPAGSLLPAVVPTDEAGNPIIVSGAGTQQPPIPDYAVTTYPAASLGHPDLTVEHRVKAGGSGPDQMMIAYPPGSPQDPVGNPLELTDNGGSPPTTTITINDPKGPWFYQLMGSWGLTPPALGSAPNVLRQQFVRDGHGRIASESTAPGSAAATTNDFDLARSCCGKSSVDHQGSVLTQQQQTRMGVPAGLAFAKSLLDGPTGAVNQLSPPFAALLDPDGPPEQQITIAYFEDAQAEWQRKFSHEGPTYLETLLLAADEFTGRAKALAQESGGGPAVPLADFEYDSYGRLVGATEHNPSGDITFNYGWDFVDGHLVYRRQGGGGAEEAFGHGPGFTRSAADAGGGAEQRWLLRGPGGQVLYQTAAGGQVQDGFHYGASGNRFAREHYGGGPEVLPAYYDDALMPLPSMPSLSQGAGGLRERTPLGPGLEKPLPSGAGGLGPSANPDVSGGWGPGGMFHGRSALPGEYAETLPATPPSELQLPPVPGSLAPPQTPPIFEGPPRPADRSAYGGNHYEGYGGLGAADLRLAGMWRAQEYYGAKPGRQTDSPLIDDTRAYSAPLPSSPGVGAGGHRGPASFGGFDPAGSFSGGWGPGGRFHGRSVLPGEFARPLPAYPGDGGLGGPGGPLPDFGPPPRLPNDQSGGSEGSGVASPAGRVSLSDYVHNRRIKNGPTAVGEQGKEEDQAQAAMDAQDPIPDWGPSWYRDWVSAQAVDDGEPDSLGEAVADAVLPFGGAGRSLYHKANAATGGRLERHFDSLSPSQANDAANLSIVAGLGLIVGAAFVAVVGGGAVAGVGTGASLATSAGQGLWLMGIRAGGAFGTALGLGGTRTSTMPGGDTYVYFGIRDGMRRYVGITNNLRRRARQHGARFDRLEEVNDSPLPHGLGKGIEQVLKERGGKMFENIRNPIDPNSPEYGPLTKAGKEWLRKTRR